MKNFMQIDRRIDVNGKSYHVRCQEMPHGKWSVFDMEHVVHISDVDKDSAFKEWEKEANRINK